MCTGMCKKMYTIEAELGHAAVWTDMRADKCTGMRADMRMSMRMDMPQAAALTVWQASLCSASASPTPRTTASRSWLVSAIELASLGPSEVVCSPSSR